MVIKIHLHRIQVAERAVEIELISSFRLEQTFREGFVVILLPLSAVGSNYVNFSGRGQLSLPWSLQHPSMRIFGI